MRGRKPVGLFDERGVPRFITYRPRKEHAKRTSDAIMVNVIGTDGRRHACSLGIETADFFQVWQRACVVLAGSGRFTAAELARLSTVQTAHAFLTANQLAIERVVPEPYWRVTPAKED